MRATGTGQGYRDSIDNLALPLKLTLALSGDERLYLKVGVAQAWTDARSGNLTEGDSTSTSIQAGLNFRPDPGLVLGLGVVAGRTDLRLRHNGGTVDSRFVGLQAEYMQRLSPAVGIAARTIWTKGDNASRIPAGNAADPVRLEQANSRLYTEASLVAELPSFLSSLEPAGTSIRPIATVMYQSTCFAGAVDSRGVRRPGSSDALGIARLAFRLEREERRQWRLVPYVVPGAEFEFANDVSVVDDDPLNTYVKAGLGMNVGGHGRVDLFYVRRDSLRGTFSSNQVTLFASLLF